MRFVHSLFLRRLLLAGAVLTLTSLATQAQPGGGITGGPPDPTPNSPAAVPLDGGASLLLASGVAYGLRRLRAKRRS